ncbi:hypothetical protein SAY86_025558 [Trapa natans]|uniref:Uncharacterized protein n=1 Tax=Trapa natans TaxID=22666 RepID=A0AAN7RKV7_TRANT|nr:hypothetical protein SAY86_025558 [Trapa natans]
MPSLAIERNVVVLSRILGNRGRQPGNSLSPQIIRTFSKDEIPITPYSQKGKNGYEIITEDGILESVPRMRGLQDFGLKIASPKRKLSSSTVDGFLNHRKDAINFLHGGDQGMENTSYVDGAGDVGVMCREKRSRCMYLSLDNNYSLNGRDIPQRMMDVSPSTSWEGNIYHNTSMLEGNGFRLSGDGDCSSSEIYLSESELDSYETGQNTIEGTTSLSDSDFMGMQEAQGHGSISSEEPEYSAHSADASHLPSHDHSSKPQAVSKWQLKGKRNVRNLPSKHLGRTDKKVLIGSSHRIQTVDSGNNFGKRAPKWGRHALDSDFKYSTDKADESGDYLEAHFFGGHDYQTPRVLSKGRHLGSPRMIGWDDLTLGGAHPEPVLMGRTAINRGQKLVLFEVDIKVQVSYQRERVPVVSMTSKLNGTSIIGHSIQIEAIDCGLMNHLLPSSNHDMSQEAIYRSRRIALPPAWRTARRTANFRVPRLNSSSTFDGDDDAEGIPYVDQEMKSLQSLSAGSFGQKGFLVRRGARGSWQMVNQQSNTRIPSKLRKRESLWSSRQKIRTLSSIAVAQNFGSECMLDGTDGGIDGLIERGPSKPTTVACIPMKLVFSRLLEKINRPPWKGLTTNA